MQTNSSPACTSSSRKRALPRAVLEGGAVICLRVSLLAPVVAVDRMDVERARDEAGRPGKLLLEGLVEAAVVGHFRFQKRQRTRRARVIHRPSDPALAPKPLSRR